MGEYFRHIAQVLNVYTMQNLRRHFIFNCILKHDKPEGRFKGEILDFFSFLLIASLKPVICIIKEYLSKM